MEEMFQAQYPDRLSIAKKAIKGHVSDAYVEVGYLNADLVLLKESEDFSVFRIDNAVNEDDFESDSYDYDFSHETNLGDNHGYKEWPSIVVNADCSSEFMVVFCCNDNVFTLNEINKWRYDLFKSLLALSEEDCIWTKEECLSEIVGLNNYLVASMMAKYSPNDYAWMVLNGEMDESVYR